MRTAQTRKSVNRQERAKRAFLGLFDRHWKPDNPGTGRLLLLAKGRRMQGNSGSYGRRDR
jgi:hypothetical protein